MENKENMKKKIDLILIITLINYFKKLKLILNEQKLELKRNLNI